MKHFLFFAMLFFTVLSCNQNKRVVVKDIADDLSDIHAIDTIRLVNDMSVDYDFYFLSWDTFGDNADFDKIGKEKTLKTENPYLELTQGLEDARLFWLNKGATYHVTAENNRIAIFQSEDKIHSVEALFFVQLYADNSNLTVLDPFSRGWNQIKNELKKGVFQTKSEERYKQKLAYLETRKENLSPIFCDLCAKFFFVEFLDDLLFLYQRDKGEEVKQILLRHKEAIQYEDLFFSQKYRFFCQKYRNFLLCLESNTTTSNELHLSLMENFNGKIRDYLLLQSIREQENGDRELFTVFYNDCQNEEYKNYIKRELQIKEKLLLSKELLIQTDLVQISLQDILSKHKGKLIYVDFWASWCAPCRALMPQSLQLKELLRNEVAFIYISIDENSGQWLKATKNENLDEKYSYLISRESTFIKVNKIKSIPRYMIFDKTGKLIDDNAMRPDDKNFVEKMKEIFESTPKTHHKSSPPN
jgi:thiol-disulfide isomerase/thioredoxin